MTLKSGKYQTYGDPRPDGTYQIAKTLWDGTNIQVSQRVGDEEREWVSALLAVMYVRGYLTKDEFSARNDAALKAVTRPDLNRLIADLPKEEDDWRKERKVPMDKALLQEAIKATTPKRSHVENFFPLFIVLGIFTFLARTIGLGTTSLTIYAGIAGFMGFVSIWAGLILSRKI